MNKMIFNALVVVMVVGAALVSADFTCPDGKVTCVEGKACCYESGSGYSCCDKPDDDRDLTPGIRSVGQPSFNQSIERSQSYLSDSIYDYCPYTTGKKICCVSEFNCQSDSECCNSQTCCQRSLHPLRCCGDGQWCCLKKAKCGPYFNTCRNGAGMQGVQGVAVIVTVALAAIKFARI